MTRAANLPRRLARRLPPPVKQRLLTARRWAARARLRVVESTLSRAVVTTVGIVRRAPRAEPIDTLLERAEPLVLDQGGPWYRIEADGSRRFLLTVETAEPLAADARAGVIQYRFIDVWGMPFHAADAGKASARGVGAHDWIPRAPTGATSTYLILVPHRAVAVDVRLAQSPGRSDTVTVTATNLEALGPRTSLEPIDAPPVATPRSDLRLAVVADTFTISALRYEAHVLAVTQHGWRRELESFRPDLLFIESAWNGNEGEWRYCLASLRPDDQRLRDLVAGSRALGIPVLFWNKEDPAHFDDFLAAARLADVVATTDAAMIPRYRAELGDERILALPFCIQPDIHNPRLAIGTSSERMSAAVFLGSWWASKFDARRLAQQELFAGAAGYGLEIFDRYLTFDDHERYRFGPEWLRYVHGTLSYDEALNAYRRYAVVLNVNTVTDSPTMFSRRALEAAACGALVVTNPAAGTTAALGDLALAAATADECRAALARVAESDGFRDRLAHRAYRHTHRQHSWSCRLRDIAERCNIAFPSAARPKVSVVLATKRPAGADRIIRYLASLDHEHVEIDPILITAFDPAELAAVAEIERTGCRVERERPGETLGDCLNRGATMATGGLIAKVDDDDLYGLNYFADLCLALDHSRADIVGKSCYYQHFEATDTTVIRYRGREHQFVSFVCGSTLLARADVYGTIQFPQRRVGEDTEFLRRAVEADLRIYSADRFNYVSMRRADLQSHTWREHHDTLLERNLTRPWCTGLPTADLDV